jgi:UDP-sulfoquinovose synthase
MRILVLGGDGYLGWPTAVDLASRGHDVAVVDNYVKRTIESKIGVTPLLEVPRLHDRSRQLAANTGWNIEVFIGDISKDYEFLSHVLNAFEPEAIVHYAEQPSAPYSMAGVEEAVFTQVNNVVGTLNLAFAVAERDPSIHIVKLGTMGEYGTPEIPIEEGWLEITHGGRHDRVLFPKRPHSIYHLSKVHDSNNLEFMCRTWGFRVTDLNQGVVYGHRTNYYDDAGFSTSFHYDGVFGTVINRFAVQAAMGMPLTVYGAGGQTRGYLNIKDTLECINLALLNPADAGEFRVFNQFTETFSVMDIARQVVEAAGNIGIQASIAHTDNPRNEKEEHFYEAAHTGLVGLGLQPHFMSHGLLEELLRDIQPWINRVNGGTILNSPTWTGVVERTPTHAR